MFQGLFPGIARAQWNQTAEPNYLNFLADILKSTSFSYLSTVLYVPAGTLSSDWWANECLLYLNLSHWLNTSFLNTSANLALHCTYSTKGIIDAYSHTIIASLTTKVQSYYSSKQYGVNFPHTDAKNSNSAYFFHFSSLLTKNQLYLALNQSAPEVPHFFQEQ
jgi:hypothetical protein